MCFRFIFPNFFHKKRKSLHEKASDSLEQSFADASNTISPHEAPRVIIIGAGAAGLACAMRLQQFGFENILILEAENRIGGRIHTKMFADNVVDMGAQWVHGETNNIVYEMVQERGYLDTTGNIYETFESIRSNGRKVPVSVVDRFKKKLKEIFDNCSEDLTHCGCSFGEYLNDRFHAALRQPEMKDIEEEIALEFFENFKRIESSETSSGVEEVSAKGFSEYWQCPGDYLLNWKDKGYVTFLRMLMGADDDRVLGDLENVIKFESKVDHIQWNRKNRRVIVRCGKGESSYEADHVVVTVSLGVLKNSVDSMFHPPLPIQKKRAIIGLGYGSVCKIYLEFSEKFWPDNWYGFTTLWIKEDLEELRKSKYEWVEEIFGFYCVNYQPRVLLAWIVGPYVLKVEKMPEAQVREGCMYLLRRFLVQYKIPDPINMQVTSWQSNPNFNGAYSFRSMLSEELNVSAFELAQPLTIPKPEKLLAGSLSSTSSDGATMDLRSSCVKPILLFAGEATSKHHYSTVHGAVESGYREANRLITYYRKG